MEEPRRRFAAMQSAGEESRTVYSLLYEALPLLLNFGASGALDNLPRPPWVKLVDTTYGGPWELPVLGQVPAPAAVLVRPDGHVAWVGGGSDTGLQEALARLFGPARG